MHDRLGRLAVRHPGKVCLAWLALACALTIVAPSWQARSQDDDIHFLPPSSPSVRGYELLERAFPQDVFASRAVVAVERADRRLSPADFALVDRLADALADLRRSEPDLGIGGVVSHRDGLIGSRLVSDDRQATLIQVSLGTPYLAAQTRAAVDRIADRLRCVLATAGADAPAVSVTGPAGIGRDLIAAGADGLDRTTVATVVLVVAVLLLVYRSPLLALVPLATIGVSIWVALELLSLATLLPGIRPVNVSRVFAVVILFGAGTDYCLFLISRYREELESGQPAERGLRRSVRTVGGPLAASAGTVICGLGLMGFAEFAKVRSAGPVIGLGLAVGLAASLTLTPALLRLCGQAAFWPREPRPRPVGLRRPDGVWDRIAAGVVAWPGWVFAAALAVLVPSAVLGLCVRPTFSPIGDLGPTAESVRGLEAIRRHFTAGETGPLTVLLASDTDWDGPDGRKLIRRLSRGFGQLDNVAEVRSLTQPLGRPLPDLPANGSHLLSGVLQWAGPGVGFINPVKAARGHYLATLPTGSGPRFVTRLDVVLITDPFAPESATTLETVETWLDDFLPERTAATGPVRTEVFGATVHTRDLAAVIGRDRLRVNALVSGGVFLILLVLVRRLWLAGYLLATVLLSYFATLGLTALFAAAWGGKPFGDVEWRVPFFLFTILVAVGEDYNILLVTRAAAERKRHGATDGVRRGLARTGGTITACGLIMAGTFATLMLSGLGTLVQIGFALAVGVLLDTLVVRPFLVPTALLAVWRDEESAVPPLRLPKFPPPSNRRAA
ncbi:MAG TPA: MMPL family transporter [Gemmataceae bacterium]|jgi:RND superfamily putative drug exporter